MIAVSSCWDRIHGRLTLIHSHVDEYRTPEHRQTGRKWMIAAGSTNRGPRLDMQCAPNNAPTLGRRSCLVSGWLQLQQQRAGRTLGLATRCSSGARLPSFFSLCLSIISPLSINIRHNGLHESRYICPARLYGRSLHPETGCPQCHPRLLFQEHCTPSPPYSYMAAARPSLY